MSSPRYRSVAVHWPRLIVGAAAMTVLLSLAASWEPLARMAEPVFDSGPLAMVTIGVLFALVVGVGRPTAEYELWEHGILKREGLVFSLFRRAYSLPWQAVTEMVVAEEMDGSRSLTLRTRHGAEWKIWEKFGTPGAFDAFREEIAERLRRAPRNPDAAAPAIQVRSIWDGAAPRVVVAVLAAGWVALAVATFTGPAAGRAQRLPALLATVLLLAPLAWRAFARRRPG